MKALNTNLFELKQRDEIIIQDNFSGIILRKILWINYENETF
jgi:hypothetical protein